MPLNSVNSLSQGHTEPGQKRQEGQRTASHKESFVIKCNPLAT